MAFRLDFKHGLEGTVARRTAGTKGNREKFGIELGQLSAGSPQLFRPFWSLGRKKLKTESGSEFFL
jgi:hypothetical protein